MQKPETALDLAIRIVALADQAALAVAAHAAEVKTAAAATMERGSAGVGAGPVAGSGMQGKGGGSTKDDGVDGDGGSASGSSLEEQQREYKAQLVGLQFNSIEFSKTSAAAGWSAHHFAANLAAPGGMPFLLCSALLGSGSDVVFFASYLFTITFRSITLSSTCTMHQPYALHRACGCG